MSDFPLRTIIEILVAAVIVTAVIPGVIQQAQPTGFDAVNATTEDYTSVGDRAAIPGNVEVSSTKANALRFNETGSVEASGPTNLTDNDWSVCAAPELDNASLAPINLTYDIWAYKNETALLQLDHGDWVAYYNNSSMDALTRVSADAPRDGFHPICTRYDDDSGTLWLRTPSGWDSDKMDNTVESRNVSVGWIGRIDEVRTYRTPISNATMSTYADDQIEPLPGTDRASRMMFDEGSGSTTAVYFDGSTATIRDAEWVDGIPGPATGGFFKSLTTETLREGSDYAIGSSPFSIKIVEGGYLEGAPVEYVSWGGAHGLLGFVLGFIPVLAGLLVIVVIANRIEEMV